MAEIYRARTRSTLEAPARWVALKMMRPAIGHEALRERLFRREARIASAIQHPNVIPLHAYGEELGRHYLAMEYVQGRDLSHLAKPSPGARDRLPFELVLYLGLEAAAGLGHAHRLCDERGQPLGIVHRDVSPGNVMVGYDGVVKVLDFGVARLNESDGVRTQTGTLRGKFAYMSPEQTLGEPLDARSDVFSLGTVLYELLTGVSCFRADNPIATLERVQRVRPAPPSRANRALPRAVDRILARCLAKDRSRRFADCGYLAEALREFLTARAFDGRSALAEHMRARFAAEREEELEELLAEEEEVALFDVIDFAMVGEDAGLDASHVAVSLEEEASQAEVHKAHREQPTSEDEVEVFDEVLEREGLGRERAGTPSPRPTPTPPRAGRLGAALAVHPPLADEDETTLHQRVFDPDAVRPGSSVELASVLDRERTARAPVPGAARASDELGAEPTAPRRTLPPELAALAHQGRPAEVPSAPTAARRFLRSRALWGVSLAAALVLGVALLVAGGVASEADRAAVSSRRAPPRTELEAVTIQLGGAEGADGGAARPEGVGEVPPEPPLGEVEVTEPPRADLRREAGATPAPRPKGVLGRREAAASDGDGRARPVGRPAPRRASANATGYLNLGAKPWAEIVIDGRPWPYQTPQAGIELSAGRHTVTLSNPETKQLKTLVVLIKAGEYTTVSADLRRR